jgi:hypothetical protein
MTTCLMTSCSVEGRHVLLGRAIFGVVQTEVCAGL